MGSTIMMCNGRVNLMLHNDGTIEIKNFEEAEKKSRVPAHDIQNYATGSRNKVYGWEVSAVREYEKPLVLVALGIKRAPQSWQYIKRTHGE